MVLSRLTKITGPGIRTDTNWVGNNANYTGILTASSLGGIGNITATGIITASSFSGDGSGLIGVASTDNIITGTAATFNTYPVDINAGMTVAGVATFAGNVSIAGTLTYEDVTNIDSVGIITGKGADINGDLDVDGHTNLDNVSVAGVSTFSDNLKIIDDKKIIVGNGLPGVNDLEIFHQSSNNYNYIKSPARGFIIQNAGNSATYISANYFNLTNANISQTYATANNYGINLRYNNQQKLRTASSGIEVIGVTTTTGLAVTGVSTFSGNILPGTDSSHNIGSNSVRFANVYGDALYGVIQNTTHTNITRVGTLSQLAVSGTANPLNITHTSANCVNLNRGGKSIAIDVNYGGSNTHSLINLSSGMDLRFKLGGTDKIVFKSAGHIEPQTDSQINLGSNTVRFANVYADTYYGDGSNLSNITSTTINNNANNRLITGSGTANTLEGESTITYDNPTLEINTDTSPYGTLTLNGTTGGLVQFEDNEVTKWSIFGDHALNFYNNANSLSRLYINSSGQMGLGVEPNTNWPTNNDFKALQIGTGACVFGRGSGDEDRGGIAVNWYSDGSNNKYLGNGNAARIYLADGNIYFSTAGANSSGANAAMTLNDKMILSSSGRLGIAGFQHNYTMNSQSTDLVIGDGGGGRGITLWTAAAADNQTISFQTNETLSRAEGEISYGPTATSTVTDRNAMMFRTNSNERMRITSSGRFGFNRSAPHYAMHLSPADGETRIDLHMTNSTTGHNSNDGVQFGYQNTYGAYIWNFENTPIYMATNNVKKFEIHATGSTQIYKGDLLLGPDSVSQMEATIRAWGCSLWYTTIDTDYYHDSGGEFRVFYNKGEESGDNYLTAYNCPIVTGVGPQNRVFWRGANNDTRAEGTVNIGVGYRGAFFFISRTCPDAVRAGSSGKYLYDSNSPNRVSVSFDSFGNNIDTQELSFHCGSTAGYNSGDATVGGRLGSSNTDTTLRMYAVGVNMQNYNAPNNKKAGNHLGISVINEDGTDYGSSRLSENLINNGTTGSTNGGGGSTEFNWGTRHSNDRGYNSNMQFSQILYFDGIQLNSSQWDYLEHYFKVMYG